MNSPVKGACIVQRLNPGTFARSGNLISITVRAASDGELRLSSVTISRPAASGDDFDSFGTPINLTPSPVTVPKGQHATLPPVRFDAAASEAHLIAFDVGDPGNARVIGGVPHTAYIKQPPTESPITEAHEDDRSGYTAQPNILWLIEAIDVATKWPQIP